MPLTFVGSRHSEIELRLVFVTPARKRTFVSLGLYQHGPAVCLGNNYATPLSINFSAVKLG